MTHPPGFDYRAAGWRPTGAAWWLAEFAGALTANRTYTLQDSDMVLAAINLAQTFTQTQTFSNLTKPVIMTDGTNAYEYTFDAGYLVLNVAKGLVIYSTFADAPLYIQRVTTATNAGRAVFALQLDSTGDMADGFGPIYSFIIKDTANVANVIGQMFVTRDGADNSGRYQLAVQNLGVLDRKFVANPTGVLLGTGIISTTNPGFPAHAFLRDSTNAVGEVLAVEHESSGTALAGFGSRKSDYLKVGSTVRQLMAAVDTILTNATLATRTAAQVFYLTIAGTLTEVMRLSANGIHSKGRVKNTRSLTGDATALISDDEIVFTSGPYTLTLPASPTVGQSYRIGNESSANCYVRGAGTDTIKGVVIQTLPPGSDIIVTCYAANKWY